MTVPQSPYQRNALDAFLARTLLHYAPGRSDVPARTAEAVVVAACYAIAEAEAASDGAMSVQTLRTALVQVADSAAASAELSRASAVVAFDPAVTSIERYFARWSDATASELRSIVRALETEFAPYC